MTGHVRNRGTRSWELKFDIPSDASGRRKTRYHSFKGTKREAEAELVKLKAGADRGEYVDASKITVADFLERWLQDWAALNVSPKTQERYGELIRKHIIPRIGEMPLQRLRAVHLSELYSALAREASLAPRTIGHAHRVLHRAIGHATQWSVVHSNPAASIRPPKVESTEIEILKPAEVQTVMEKLNGRTIHPIVVTALATGMRRGELLALRWQDVDLDRAHTRVERSLEQTKAGLRFKEPKTRHGRRSITLPAFAVSALRLHWKAQQEMRLALGLGKAPADALVFATFDGKPRSPNALTKEWSVAAKAMGLAVTLHALRHTHASQLIASGLDVLTISRRLGHSSPTVTLGVYGHLFSNTDDRAAKALDAAFSRSTE